MMDVVHKINSLMWGPILIPLLVGTGIFYTIRLKFVQSMTGKAYKEVFGGALKKSGKADEEGMSSFQALATAIAAQVGTGNLAGVATALAAGGPGAIFWMWVSAFFGMATNYGEAVLGQLYKTKVDGQITGGPAYYISQGIKNRYLAGFFAVAIILALGFMGNMVQANSIVDVSKNVVDVSPIIIGIIVAVIVGGILVGGISGIASFTEKVVPFMAVLYIVGGLAVIFMNAENIIPSLRDIFVGAFDPQALGGGLLGITVMNVIRYGVARGLFSNEAGMGSTPHAHAVAKVDHPGEQGLVALVGVTFDTMIICTLTALIILTSGAMDSGASGAALTQIGFERSFGHAGTVFVAVALFFFALTTIVGWYYFGEGNIRYLFGKRGVLPYKILVLVMIIFGSTLDVAMVWELADMFNGFMIFPNLVALLILSPKVVEALEEYKNVERLKVQKQK
ncbi:amino-acid carrier protein AlsT [Andreesenia angusta]|uniref:Amino-acid carrier protein AlsT n=1 Tax=Andreesenia angusta TaxID=39480 RepID=A0A1S1V4H2_9FIRM|nr:sodium:alanine symporter family protein [Andreesenia angusta]OHW61591.1 amino-acid carrier protein AlsT [Andreesenia angusta]